MRVLVVGKAKTGTTALMSLIRQAVEPCELVMEPQSVIGFGKRSLQRSTEGTNEIIKVLWEHYEGRRRHLDALVHAEFGFPVDKVVFISRDARDEMVSKLLYHAKICRDGGITPEPREQTTARWIDALRAKEQDPASISFRDLCRTFDDLYGTDLWSRLTAIREKREFEHYIHARAQRAFFVMPYDDLIADRTDRLADYLGVPLTVPSAEVDLGRYGYTKRSARADSWRHFFTAEDVEILSPLLGQMLPGKRYEDWNLASSQQLESAEVSEYVARIAAVE